MEEWKGNGNNYIYPLSLLNNELNQSKKTLCLSVADGNVVEANNLYSNFLLSEIYEWQAIKLATSYQNREN